MAQRDVERIRDHRRGYVTTNVLATKSIYKATRRAVAKFLRQCREASIVGTWTDRYLAAKLEKGDIRFSVKLKNNGPILVEHRSRVPESFTKTVNFLRELGLKDSYEGEWRFVNFTARSPMRGRGALCTSP